MAKTTLSIIRSFNEMNAQDVDHEQRCVFSIWKEFYAPLKGFVAKRVNDHAAVDDIVQNVFIKIANHISEVKDSQKIRIWIYQITRNTIIDYYRIQKPTEELPPDLPMIDEHDEQDLSKELSSYIKPLIGQLPDKYREAIELTELNGISQMQLSEQLGLSFSGAKSRVQRGREKLKELLTACCHIEADRYGNIVNYQKVEHTDDSCHSNGNCGCE
jgi:RNA polymerase sigma-70 factor (ECF subfamily)